MSQARRAWSGVMVVVMAVVFGVSGCTTAAGVPSPGQMPDGMSFAGLWYSDQFEHMYLHQEGDRVEGVYAYGTGGKISGEVRGNLLVFDWEEPGSRDQVRRTMRGKGYLQLVADGDGYNLVGEWGYNEDHRGAGPWTADFIRSPENEDPRTLDEIRRIH